MKMNIYHSYGCLAVLFLLGLLLFVAGGLFVMSEGYPFLGWVSIIFFCLIALKMLFITVKELLFHIPFILITDEYVKINKSFTSHKVFFRDVEMFYTAVEDEAKAGFVGTLSIKYKDEDLGDQNGDGKDVTNQNVNNRISQFRVTYLQVTSIELCNMLNEKLKTSMPD